MKKIFLSLLILLGIYLISDVHAIETTIYTRTLTNGFRIVQDVNNLSLYHGANIVSQVPNDNISIACDEMYADSRFSVRYIQTVEEKLLYSHFRSYKAKWVSAYDAAMKVKEENPSVYNRVTTRLCYQYNKIVSLGKWWYLIQPPLYEGIYYQVYNSNTKKLSESIIWEYRDIQYGASAIYLISQNRATQELIGLSHQWNIITLYNGYYEEESGTPYLYSYNLLSTDNSTTSSKNIRLNFTSGPSSKEIIKTSTANMWTN